MIVVSVRKKLCFATVVVVAVLGSLELVARGVEFARGLRNRPGVETAVTARLGPLRYELVPGGQLPVAGTIARINSAGFRGPEPDRPKRRLRVFCLGDSCTFGYAPDVTDERTYPACLARRLDSKRFEVINGGMPNFGALDCLNLLLYKGLELEPDYVVILAGWNDYRHAQPLVGRSADADQTFLNRSAFLRLEGEVVRRVVGPPRLNLARERARLRRQRPPTDALSDVVFARTERVIGALVGTCRAHGSVPILVTYSHFTRPEWSDVDSLTDAELRPALPELLSGARTPAGWHRFAVMTNARIRAVAARLKVPLVDGEAIRDPALFEDLLHLRAAGCAALAERVAPVLERAAAHCATGAFH